jgi:hypothetical protein
MSQSPGKEHSALKPLDNSEVTIMGTTITKITYYYESVKSNIAKYSNIKKSKFFFKTCSLIINTGYRFLTINLRYHGSISGVGRSVSKQIGLLSFPIPTKTKIILLLPIFIF